MPLLPLPHSALPPSTPSSCLPSVATPQSTNPPPPHILAHLARINPHRNATRRKKPPFYPRLLRSLRLPLSVRASMPSTPRHPPATTPGKHPIIKFSLPRPMLCYPIYHSASRARPETGPDRTTLRFVPVGDGCCMGYIARREPRCWGGGELGRCVARVESE